MLVKTPACYDRNMPEIINAEWENLSDDCQYMVQWHDVNTGRWNFYSYDKPQPLGDAYDMATKYRYTDHQRIVRVVWRYLSDAFSHPAIHSVYCVLKKLG
jgi:hypothetical protein